MQRAECQRRRRHSRELEVPVYIARIHELLQKIRFVDSLVDAGFSLGSVRGGVDR
jgi:hypothetical protein